MLTSTANVLRAILVGAIFLASSVLIERVHSQDDIGGNEASAQAPIEVVIGDGIVTASSGNEPFATYDFTHYAKPILYPLYGPGGIAVTRNYPMKAGVAGETTDHEHHKSVWFAHGKVNGLDFWSEKARIGAEEIKLLDEHTDAWPGFVARSFWLNADKPVLSEQATVRFADRGAVRFVDFAFVLRAETDVRFGDTKEGTFALRTHPNLQLKREEASLPVGHAENSAGQTDGAIWGQRAEWVSYFGQIDGIDMGIAIFDHPDNLRHPTTWHARDYGLVAANPFGLHDFLKQPAGSGDFELAQGSELKLRYRLAVYRHKFDRDVVKAWYSEFCNVSMESDKHP